MIDTWVVSPATVAFVVAGLSATAWAVLVIGGRARTGSHAMLAWGTLVVTGLLIAQQFAWAVSNSYIAGPQTRCDLVVRSESFVLASEVDVYTVRTPVALVLPSSSSSTAEPFGHGDRDRFDITWTPAGATVAVQPQSDHQPLTVDC